MSQARLPSTFSPRRTPFLYLTAALVAGILVDQFIEPARLITAAFAVVSIAASIKLLLAAKDTAATIALLLSFMFAGVLVSSTDRTRPTTSRLESLYETSIISADNPVELTATLVTPPEPAPGAYYLEADAHWIRKREEIMPATGRARLMISISDRDAQSEFAQLALDYGSIVRVLVRLEHARGYANPGSPHFDEFLDRRGYDLKGVIKSPLLIEHIGDARRSWVLAILYRLRLRIMDAIDVRFKPRVAGTLKAMLAGNRYFLDRETAEQLREGSTFHTLVIAGLHIGIIAWALLGGRSAIKRRSALRVIVCLAVLWAYAVMVGLAPPVTRATTMITVGLVGPLLFRRSASINTVALAAFVMLALKPALLADPGFQLSFVAVAGIVTLALPLAEKLRIVGQWRPNSRTPHPPSCSRPVRYFAETLFWNERAFAKEMRRSPIRYQMNKAGAARVLGRLRIQRLLKGAVLLAITSGAIQLTTLPLMALYFNRVAPVGVLLNVVAGLLTGVLMLTAVCSLALGGFSQWIAAKLGMVVNAAHYLLVNAIAPFTDISLATFRVAHYEGWYTIIYVLFFVPLVMLALRIDRWEPVDRVAAIDRRRANTARESVVTNIAPHRLRLRVSPSFFRGLAMAAALVAVIRPPINHADGKLIVHFLDVGQGDCALLIFPRGKTMLVDAGGEIRFDKLGRNDGSDYASEAEDGEKDFRDNAFSIGEVVVSRFIWSLGRTRVDYVLATHAHADHMGGFSDVVRNFSVGQAIVGHAPATDPEYEQFECVVRRQGIQLATVSAGEHFQIDGVSIEVLWPAPPSNGPQVISGNNDSVVLRLVYGSVSLLLAGDIEQGAEDSLVASAADLRSDVLKVPHHGSRTSSSDAFINAVSPRYGVISVGERSRFGHPHASVVNRYIAHGVKLFQTGRDGMVTLETDGSTVEITTYKSR